MNERFVALAEIARPHGIRGEVRLKLFNADSDVLLGREDIIVRLPDGKEQVVRLEGARRADKTILLKLHAVDDRDQAEALRGASVGLNRADLPKLADGELYVCDVEGAEVRLGDTRIGVVERFEEYPTASVIVVKKTDGTRIDVPFVTAIVERVDVEARVVILSSLELS
jgi:16S rRNA processing protein RimM